MKRTSALLCLASGWRRRLLAGCAQPAGAGAGGRARAAGGRRRPRPRCAAAAGTRAPRPIPSSAATRCSASRSTMASTTRNSPPGTTSTIRAGSGPGQQLRIAPPAGAQEAPVTVSPVTSAGAVESRPLGAPGRQRGSPRRAPAAAGRGQDPSPSAQAAVFAGEPGAAAARRSAAEPAQPEPHQPERRCRAAARRRGAEARAAGATTRTRSTGAGRSQGKIIAGFSEASNKGLDIAGKLGDPVIAAAPGRVVYSGSGLRGYGKLVIIKHNKTYLSAYAHNKRHPGEGRAERGQGPEDRRDRQHRQRHAQAAFRDPQARQAGRSGQVPAAPT